jgi:GNAT superfamily N-acetyltransferase
MDERDAGEVARLHVRCLPDSLLSTLGAGYTASFYRYVARSEHELLAIGRDGRGRPVAAAVLSLEPATLTRRLLWRTPLLIGALLGVHRLLPALAAAFRTGRRAGAGRGGARAGGPQLILVFTAEDERGRGRATTLIRELEDRLRRRGVLRYEVRTEADPANPALEFYRRRGFEAAGLAVRFGTAFQVFTRSLAAADRTSPPLPKTPHST